MLLALWALITEHDGKAAVVCGVALISVLALAFGGFQLAPVASLIAASHLWGRWEARGGKLQVAMGGGMLLAMGVIFDLLSIWSVYI